MPDIREQLRRNTVALISLAVAITSLAYNSWRNEVSEGNRNSRTVGIEMLIGRTIKNVRYMTKAEAEKLGWEQVPVVLELDDGNIIFPSRDDEGNDGGALFSNLEDLPTIRIQDLDRPRGGG